MFRSIFDHPQGDIFLFTSVTKDRIIWFVVACLLYLLCFVLMLLRALPSLVVAVLLLMAVYWLVVWQKKTNHMRSHYVYSALKNDH